MKKLSLVLAIVLAGGMAMAQKTTWVTQTGLGNTAIVNQDALISLDALSIYATQSGSWNTLTTNQLGNNNYISLLQDGTSNNATMTQSTQDVMAAPGGKNNADITQSGQSNTANLTQLEKQVNNGSNMDFSTNTVHATQSGTSNAYILSQGSLPWEPTNASYLLQSGTNNNAVMTQTGYTNYSEINQPSDWNAAKLYQIDAAMYSPSIWDKSYSWQTGSHNNLDISQNGNPGLQLVNSVQNGNYDNTNITQLSWNEQDVVSQQGGNYETINVKQSN